MIILIVICFLQTGLIYLRARYYNPSVSRFVQIDNNYSGEKEQVVSQNKYVYTLRNPYKYVDKDGNKATTCPPVGVGAVGIGALNYLFMNNKDLKMDHEETDMGKTNLYC